MDILTADFETHYSRTYSLSKMTTEEYVRSPEYETIGVSVKRNNEPAIWFSGTDAEIDEFLHTFDWANSVAVAHNSMFDMAILNWHYGLRPKKIVDTLSMARALHGTEVGGSLAALAQHYGIGVKGTEVLDALGKRREDFTPEELARYGNYCDNDVELTYELFKCMAPHFPVSELNLIDLTIRMFTEPKLLLDRDMLVAHLKHVRDTKQKLLDKAMVDPEQLMSNDKLADLLRSLKVEPPMKISATTGKEAYAFAKTDEAFKALLEHENPIVQFIVAARLGAKSTLEETRTERFISIADRGSLPVPLRYYAARTGRWGGSDSLNLQNLPRGSKLKKSIVAPEGHVVIDCDSSQIEARTLAWFSGQDDMVEFFRKNNEEIAAGIPKKEMKFDPYKLMASQIYGKEPTDIADIERHVGKTVVLGCFGPDTQVLTDKGWKHIIEVNTTDMLWDGTEWVTHKGVIQQGMKDTIVALGVAATADHEILTEHGWREWYEVTTNPYLIQSATSKGSLPLSSGDNTSSLLAGLPDGTQLYDVRVDGKGRSTAITSLRGGRQGVIPAPKQHLTRLANAIGDTKVLSLTKCIVNGCLTAFLAAYQDAIARLAKRTRTTAEGVSTSTPNGGMIAQRSCGILCPCPDGKTLKGTSTESTTVKGTNPATYDSLPEQKTQGIGGRLKICRRRLMTYDIAYAGPRNRFTIATTVGPFIVHNCGYGVGAVKLQGALKNGQVPIDLPSDECQRIISVYRESCQNIVALWKQAGNVIQAMINGSSAPLGLDGVVCVDGIGIRLPNGLYIKYPNLRKWTNNEGKTEFVYDDKKGRAVIPTRIYGGKLVENVIQALARIAVGEQMNAIAKRYPVVLTVHDAVACIAREEEADEAVAYVEECMRMRPVWATDLPLNCESGMGRTYGDC